MTTTRDVIDGIWSNFLRLGRGSSELALKMSSNLLELRAANDTAYANFRAGTIQGTTITADSLVLSTPIASVARRQCILIGSVDSNGAPNALINPTGLTMQLGGNGTLILSFADGFDASGSPTDYLMSLAGSTTASATANTTTYFYIERLGPSSLSSLIGTTIAPIYSRTPPSSPSTGQHWFNTGPNTVSPAGVNFQGMRLYEWASGNWQSRQRIFVGEATAGASSVTSFACYAYQRRYQSAWVSVGPGANSNFAHNLGMNLAAAEASALVFSRADSSDGNPIIATNYYISSSGQTFGARSLGLTGAASRLNQQINLGSNGIHFNGSAWLTSAQIQLVVTGGW